MDTVPAPSNRSDPHVRGALAPNRPGLFALTGRPASLTARCLLVAANLASVAFFLLSYSRDGVGFGPYRIDLDVYRLGSRAWLAGANLYGALPPTSGGATVNGFDIFHQSEQVRENLGYLPENVPLYGEMKVREYLDYRGRLRKMPRVDRM